MNLDYFLKIIDKLDKLYLEKSSNEEIECTVNVNGSIYKGKYEPNCFDGESIIELNKDYLSPFKIDMMDKNNYKAYININGINAFTYCVISCLTHL